MTRYSDLQGLIKQYGDKTIDLIEVSRKLTDMILDEFPQYLECEASKVRGVPPFGEFEPGVDYRDACRSTYYRNISFLEPVYMGLCLEIDNMGDRGATWVRSYLSIWLQGERLVLSVGDHGERITLPYDLSSGRAGLYEAIYRDIERAFSLELDEVNQPRRIGFFENKEDA